MKHTELTAEARAEMGLTLLAALIAADENAKANRIFRDGIYELLSDIDAASWPIIDDLLGLPGSGITYYFAHEGRGTKPGFWGCVADGGWKGFPLGNMDEFRAFIEHNKTCPDKCAMGDRDGFVPTQRMKDEHRAYIEAYNAMFGVGSCVCAE